jgi:hypothetical protein
VALAKKLHGQRMSLRKIAAKLAARGHLKAIRRSLLIVPALQLG